MYNYPILGSWIVDHNAYTFTLTFFDIALYVDNFLDLRYLRNVLLLATFLSNDLLASKSFLWSARCACNSAISSVKSQIWTSTDPVSLSWSLNDSGALSVVVFFTIIKQILKNKKMCKTKSTVINRIDNALCITPDRSRTCVYSLGESRSIQLNYESKLYQAHYWASLSSKRRKK